MMSDNGYLVPYSDHFTVTKVGLRIQGNPTFKQWQTMVEFLLRVEECALWNLGDAFIYGKGAYDEDYTQAVPANAYKQQTYLNAQWVSSQFGFSRRRENLSWSHHLEVCGMDSAVADALLERAELEGWSIRELRQAAREKKNDTPSFDEETDFEFVVEWLNNRRAAWPAESRPRFWPRVVQLGNSNGKTAPADMTAFARFWAAYPRKTAKQDAVKAWKRLNPDPALVETLLAALERQKQSRQWREGVHPHPATWLNGRRWEDEMPTAAAPNGRHTETTAERIARLTGKNP